MDLSLTRGSFGAVFDELSVELVDFFDKLIFVGVGFLEVALNNAWSHVS